MSEWSTVVLSLGSAAVGAGAALAATVIQLRQARRERELAERASWRDKGAAILGPVLGVLNDMEPHAIADSGGRSRQTIENIGRRWWKARDDLLVFGAGNPTSEIAAGANDLAGAVAACWSSVTRLNAALRLEAGAEIGDVGVLLERASSDCEHATSLARRLGSLIRDSAAPAP